MDYNLARTGHGTGHWLTAGLCGGAAGPIVEIASEADLPKAASIHLRKARISQMLGLELDSAMVEDMLTRLGMQLTDTADGWQVQAPSYRPLIWPLKPI